MNEHEEKTVASFIVKEKRDRYKFLLNNPKKRAIGLDRLNHCSDFDPKWISWLPSNIAVTDLLRKEGSPEHVYLISDSEDLDRRTMSLEEAIEEIPMKGWGQLFPVFRAS